MVTFRESATKAGWVPTSQSSAGAQTGHQLIDRGAATTQASAFVLHVGVVAIATGSLDGALPEPSSVLGPMLFAGIALLAVAAFRARCVAETGLAASLSTVIPAASAAALVSLAQPHAGEAIFRSADALICHVGTSVAVLGAVVVVLTGSNEFVRLSGLAAGTTGWLYGSMELRGRLVGSVAVAVGLGTTYGLLALAYRVGHRAPRRVSDPREAAQRAGEHGRLEDSLVPLSALASTVLLASAALRPVNVVGATFAAVAVGLFVLRSVVAARRNDQVAQLRAVALTDELTGLANRRALFVELRAVLDRRHPARPWAVLLLDLDRFKDVNDSLGHDAGDELLRKVAARLAGVLQPRGGLLARLGGDEFALLLDGASEQAAQHTARMLQQELDRAFRVRGLDLRVGGSMGIAMWPRHGQSGRELLARADIAMYRSKAARCGPVLFSFDGDAMCRETLETIEALRACIDDRGLELHYQPKVDVSTGRVVGVEALARWRRVDGVLVGPDAFLPLAERANLMPELTDGVLRGALDQLLSWARDDDLSLAVAVNVPASGLADERFPGRVAELLAERGLDPARLTIELTETTVMADPQRCAAVLRSLRQVGVKIALDDFGAGYSSLALLDELPLDEIKLDKRFGLRAPEDRRSAAIIRSTAALARSLGLPLVVEGVETAHTRDLLEQCGVQWAQGYLFCRPVPAAELAVYAQSLVEPPALAG